MLKEIKSIKNEDVRDLKLIEDQIEEAIIDTEKKYLTDFCLKHEERIKDISNITKTQIQDLIKQIESLVTNKMSANKEEFKNRLAVAILLLEQHLKIKNSMNNEATILKNLGKENSLIATIADTLIKDTRMLEGIEEVKNINKEFHSAINKARYAAFIGQVSGVCKYALMKVLYSLFKFYKFTYNGYISDNNTVFVQNLKALDHLEQLMKDKDYERAWSEIEGLSVRLMLIE